MMWNYSILVTVGVKHTQWVWQGRAVGVHLQNKCVQNSKKRTKWYGKGRLMWNAAFFVMGALATMFLSYGKWGLQRLMKAIFNKLNSVFQRDCIWWDTCSSCYWYMSLSDSNRYLSEVCCTVSLSVAAFVPFKLKEEM